VPGSQIPLDLDKELTPICNLVGVPMALIVRPTAPYKTIPELIAYAKANPGKLSYGTPGVGTPQHIAGELFCFLAGIKMEHIPYRGANMADLMSGVVQVGIQNAGAAMPLVRDGRVRGIAVTSLKRTPSAPDLPTLAEQGFPGFEATSWFALLGPANLPRPIVDKVRAESLKVLADKEMEKKFSAMGLDLVGSTPEETAAAIAADIPKWAKVIRDANIKTGN
jgi:tripartite-type tricarboxylate transporter receptor subunit TctC